MTRTYSSCARGMLSLILSRGHGFVIRRHDITPSEVKSWHSPGVHDVDANAVHRDNFLSTYFSNTSFVLAPTSCLGLPSSITHFTAQRLRLQVVHSPLSSPFPSP